MRKQFGTIGGWIMRMVEAVVILSVSYVVGMSAHLVWITQHLYEIDLPTPREFARLSVGWGLVALVPTWLVLRLMTKVLRGKR